MPDPRDYTRLFEDAPVGIFRSSLDGRIVLANPALVRLLGYDAEKEVLGLDLTRDVYADGDEREALIRRISEEAFSGIETRWVRKDGREIVVRLSGRPVEDEDDELVGFETFVEDVSARHEAEGALDRVLRSSGAILVRLAVTHEGFETQWVSPSVEEVLGFSPQEALLPGWWLQGIHPDDRQTGLDAMEEALADGTVSFEYRFRNRDGEYRWFREELHLVDGDEGRVELVGYGADVTELKSREAAVRRSEERFRALTEVAPDAIVALDRSGNITYVNPRAEQMFGYDEAELLGRPFTVLFPERFRAFNRRAFHAMLGASEVKGMRPRTLLGVRRDGSEFPGEVAFAVDPQREGLALTAVIRDISERLELEAERSLLHSGHGTLKDSSGRPRGIIPVCSSCKSIKDEDGEWQPMEQYVRDRAPVEFSHGFCDDCVTKLYGSLD